MPSATTADLTQRAQTLTSAGDLVGAQRVLASALDPADAADPQLADADLAMAAALHARILIALGDSHGARQWAAYAHEAEELLHGPHDDRTMAAAATHAAVLQRVGHYGRAAQVYQKLVNELAARDGADSPRVLAAEADLATAEHASGQCQTARERLANAWTRHREQHGDASPAGIKMLARLGAMERECARDAESHEHLALAQELCARYLPADHPLVRQVTMLAAAPSTGRHVCGRVEQSTGPQDPAPRPTGPQNADPRPASQRSTGPPSAGPPSAGPPVASSPSAGPPSAGPQPPGLQDTGPWRAASQGVSPQSSNPQAVTPQLGTPQLGTPQRGTPQNAGAQSGTPHDYGTYDAEPYVDGPHSGGPIADSPRVNGARNGAPRNGAPRNADPRNADPRNADPHNDAWHEGDPHDSARTGPGPHNGAWHADGSPSNGSRPHDDAWHGDAWHEEDWQEDGWLEDGSLDDGGPHDNQAHDNLAHDNRPHDSGPPTVRQVPFPRRPGVPDPGGEGFPPDANPLRPPPDNRPTDPNGNVYQQPLYLADVHQSPGDLAGRHARADTPPPLPGHFGDFGPDGRPRPVGSAAAGEALDTPPNSERLLPVRTDRPATGRSRQPFLLVAVLIAGIAVAIAIVALTLPDANGSTSAQPTVAAPTATGATGATAGPTAASSAPSGPATAPPFGDPGSPSGVKLKDNRDSVALTWTYPKDAEGPVLISGGRAGQQLRAFQQLSAGTADYMVYGLNPTQNYCFTVSVAYATDRIAASSPVCTRR